MEWRRPQRPRTSGGFGGFGNPGQVPQDLWILLGVIFVTFSLGFFEGARILPELLRLTPAVYKLGFLWQLVTYPFVGVGAPGLWFLLELLILFWFSRSVFSALGRQRFWRLLATVAFGAGAVATLATMAADFLGGGVAPTAFVLMQGQRMATVIIIAAFATLYRNATILLFFVLPVQARWFLWLEILFAFMGFLGTRDLAGFLGICTAVGLTYAFLVPGGIQFLLRGWQLKIAHRKHESELRRLRKKRGFKVIRGDDDGPPKGPWVN